MPFFVEQRLYEPLLPLRYLDLLRHLDRFEQLCEELRLHPVQDGERDDRAQRVVARYEQLLADSATLLAPSPELVDEAHAHRAFAAGVLLLVHYEATVLSDVPLVDTVGSQTLSAFRTDLQPIPGAEERLRAALVQAFALEPEEIATIDADIARELEELRLRHALLTALDELHPLRPDDPELDTAAHALFGRLYPGHPLRPGDVQLIRTGTSLFFCVPYTDKTLDRPDFAERSAEEREDVAEFLGLLQTLQQQYFGNFPVFGPFRGERADPALLRALAEGTGSSPPQIAQLLTTMVTTLRAQEIDKYIVHDTWGHQWQAHLFEFEAHYREIAKCQRLPQLDEPPPALAGESGPTLRQALDAARARAAAGEEPDPADCDAFLRPLIRARLIHNLTGLVTETLADVIEYKFLVLAPEAAHVMESSSFLKEYPTKLDLTLIDLPFFCRMAVKGLRRFADVDERRDELLARYAAARGEAEPAPATRAAVEALRERTNELLDGLFTPKLLYDPTDAGIRLNVFARMALNLLGLNTTINRCYQQLAARSIAFQPPIDDFRDLLVLSTAAFFHQDPMRHFWHMDEFVGHYFEPCLEQLLAALAEGQQTEGEQTEGRQGEGDPSSTDA